MIKGSSIKEIEPTISKYNSNSCDYNKCEEYIRLKNKINYELKEYYEKDIHRQLKWYSYLNKIRSDANIINDFWSFFSGLQLHFKLSIKYHKFFNLITNFPQDQVFYYLY